MVAGRSIVRAPAAFVARRIGYAVDRTILTAMVRTPGRIPSSEDTERVGRNALTMLSEMDDWGWAEHPRKAHPTPIPLLSPRFATGPWSKLGIDRATFPSLFALDEPAHSVQHLRSAVNSTVHCWMLRVEDPAAPWLVCLHGLGTGSMWMDIPAFRALQIRRQSGVNIAMPVMPLHGPRRPKGVALGSLLSHDLPQTLFAVRQAVWDVRRLIGWIRRVGGERIALYGQSLGAYVAALTAGVEPVEMAIAAIPVGHIPSLFGSHLGKAGMERETSRRFLDELAPPLLRPIAIDAFPPQVPEKNRIIIAGKTDRITPSHQARYLQGAWGGVPVRYFSGGHVSYFWTAPAQRYVKRVVHEWARGER